MHTIRKSLAISAAFMILASASGCSDKKADSKEMIPGISIGMTKDEVFKEVGKDYTQSFDNRDIGYKNTVEYDYFIDSVEALDVDMPAQMFFEFEDDDKLVCYGYHIGCKGEPDNLTYPYSESELVSTYDDMYSRLCSWYGGDGVSSTDKEEDNVIKENTWETEEGQIWFIVGVDLWSVFESDVYENGINEIVLSCSALDGQ